MDAPNEGLQIKKDQQILEIKTDQIHEQKRQQDYVPDTGQQNQQSVQNAQQELKNPLEEKIENVNEHMPPVVEHIMTQTHMASYKRATARLREDRAKRLFTSSDSEDMAKIRQGLRDLSFLMEQKLPADRSLLQPELEKRYALYELLISNCNNYHNNIFPTITSAGRYRRRIVKELAESAEKEKEKLRTACYALFEQQSVQMQTWENVLSDVRAVQLDHKPEGYSFFKENNDKDGMDIIKKSVAVYRMASFLQMGDAVDEIVTAKVGEQKGFLIKRMSRQTFADLKEAISNTKDAELEYDPKALYDLTRIKELDRLLWISRRQKDYAVEWTQENGKFVVHSVKAINNGALVGTAAKRAQVDNMVDGKVAYRLLAMPKEMMDIMFADLLSKNARTTLMGSLEHRQDTLSKDNINYLQPEQYRTYAGTLLENMKADKNIAYVENKTGIHERVQAGIHQSRIRQPFFSILTNFNNFSDLKDEVDRITDNGWAKTEQWKAFVKTVKDWEKQVDDQKFSLDENSCGMITEKAQAMAHALIAWKKFLNQHEWQSEKEKEDEERCYDNCKFFYDELFGINSIGKDKLSDPKLDNYLEETARIKYGSLRGIPVDNCKETLKMWDRSEEPLFTHEPMATDIEQGFIGDCYLLTALMAIVEHNPSVIMNIMEDQGDRVKVIFPTKEVVVSKKILSFYGVNGKKEDELYDTYGAHGELWVQIMEKAYLAAGFAKDFKQTHMHEEDNKTKKLYGEEKYWNSFDVLSAGDPAVALHNILGVANESFRVLRNTVTSITEEVKYNDKDPDPSVYDSLWENTVKHTDANKEYPPHWEQIKKSLKNILKYPLIKELERRYSIIDKEGKRSTPNSLRMEDVQETLKDIRGWRMQKGQNHYAQFMKQFELSMKEYGITPTEKEFDKYLELMSEEMSEVNIKADFGLNYRSDPLADHPVYTDYALKIVEMLRKYTIRNFPIVVGTDSASIGMKNGLNGEEMLNGMAFEHAYMVKCVRMQGEHYYIQMHNPWKKDVPQYGTVTEVDGSTHTTTILNKDAGTEGMFEFELNDFMAYFTSVSFEIVDLSKAKKNDVLGGNVF